MQSLRSTHYVQQKGHVYYYISCFLSFLLTRSLVSRFAIDIRSTNYKWIKVVLGARVIVC